MNRNDNIDFGDGSETYDIPLGKRPHISFLLGSGFSAPMGYPTGYSMNDKIFNFEENNRQIGFYNWEIVDRTKGCFCAYDQSQIVYNSCINLIKEFKKDYETFDYEEFYSFLTPENLATYDDIIKDAIGNTDFTSGDVISNLRRIYSQMIRYCLKDKNGCQYYKEESHVGKLYNEYDNILKYISHLSNEYIVDVHTLNHDVLFESFNYTDYLCDKLSDGFSELGSSYYGKCQNEGFAYTIRLEQFKKENYNDKPVRLYKLHGSIDYVDLKGDLDELKLVKRKVCIKPDSIMEDNGSPTYKTYPFHDFCDFLTGTEKDYTNEPYKSFIEMFEKNLKCAEKLIIIGYGFKDKNINRIIMNQYNYQKIPIHIVDRNNMVKYGLALNAQFHPKGIEETLFDELFPKEL